MQQLMQPVTSIAAMAMLTKLITAMLGKSLLAQVHPMDMSLSELFSELASIEEATMTLTQRKAWRAYLLIDLNTASIAITKRNKVGAIEALEKAFTSATYYMQRYPAAAPTARNLDSALLSVHQEDWGRALSTTNKERDVLARGIFEAERETESMQGREEALNREKKRKISIMLKRQEEERRHRA